MNSASLPFKFLRSLSGDKSERAQASSTLRTEEGLLTSAPTEAALVEFKGLAKRYGRVSALGGIDLAVPQGSVLAVLGPNGAGKSTLFGCLLGLVRPTAGAIHWRGESINDSHRRRFGYLAERVALYPQRTVRENGLFFARLKNQTAAELERQLQRVGLQAVQDRAVRQLSKGMLQRLGLAIALCGQPELLVLDEPFNGLDPALLDGLQRILREEHDRGATLLISTHTMSAIEPLATHVAVILQGSLALSSTLESLRSQFQGAQSSSSAGSDRPDRAEPELCTPTRLGGEPSLETIYHRLAREYCPGNLEAIVNRS